MAWKSFFVSIGGTLAVVSAAACSSSRLITSMPAVGDASAALSSRPAAGRVSESILHSFGGVDGAGPASGVIRDKSGAFYGTTIFGGALGGGTVFRLSPQSGGYREDVLHSFGGGVDGDAPIGGLIADRTGALYGTTLAGGLNNGGTVFKLTPTGSQYKKTTLYLFGPQPDVSGPLGSLVMDRQGNLFGAAQSGGSANLGGVFELSPNGSHYKESVLYRFPGGAGGYVPQGGVAMDRAGNVFGTAWGGGDLTKCEQAGCGLVFKLTRSGGLFTESVAYDFQGSPTDGSHPQGTVTVDDRVGTVYGTTPGGGVNGVRVLLDFANPRNGADPENTTLVTDRTGALYGTTRSGGAKTNCSDGGPGGAKGCGVVFKLTP